MNPDRWQAVGELFDEAVGLPPADRATWLHAAAAGDEELIREVESLLKSYEAAGRGFVQHQVEKAVVSFDRFAEVTPPDTRLGPYRLLHELGAGGMGVVFLAERIDEQYTALVAVKLIRPGMDTEFLIARFRRERQALARLQHPNIARLLDGGSTETGLPYFVMEYVEGVSLTEYVRTGQPRLPARLELFLALCDAVDYAHRSFVVHRDIKPGNILVDAAGVPKLVDFGICKLLQNDGRSDSETRVQMHTPNYGSPEQIFGETITLRSDIYSLGAVLYELLSGVLPRNMRGLNPAECRRMIAEDRITPPSTVCADKATARLLEEDLDHIVLHALALDPAERYQSAAQFADDLRRHLTSQPILARPQTAAYRIRKFVKRHQALVVSTVSVIVALGIGLGTSIRQTRNAHRHLLETQSLAGKLVFEVHDAIKDLPGSTQARGLVIRTGTDALRSSYDAARGDSRTETNLALSYRKLGDVQGDTLASNLGDPAAALDSYTRASTLLESALAREPSFQQAATERLVVEGRIARLQAAGGHPADAAATLKAALGHASAAPSDPDPAFLDASAQLHLDAATSARSRGSFAESLAESNEGLRLERLVAARGGKPEALASAWSSVGMAEASLERLPEAQAHFRQAVQQTEQQLAANAGSVALRRELMLAQGHLADVTGNPGLHNLGDPAGALDVYRRAAQTGRELYLADKADQRAAADYGIVLSRVETVMDDSNSEGKRRVQEESLQVLEQAIRGDPQKAVLRIYQALEQQHLGDSLLALHDVPRARDLYRTSIVTSQPALRRGDLSALRVVITSGQKLAGAEVMLGHRAAALEAAKSALATLDPARCTAPQRLILPRAYAAMGSTLAALSASPLRQPSDRGEARLWLQKSLTAWQQVADDPSFGSMHRQELLAVQTLLQKFL